MRHRYDAEVLSGYGDVDSDLEEDDGLEDMGHVELGVDPTPERREVTFEIVPQRGGGYRGVVRIPTLMQIPTGDGSTYVPAQIKATGPKAHSKRTAAQKAGRVVGKILDSKEFQQVQQSLPPQAQAAIMAIQVARKSKALRKVANKAWKTVKGWFD